MKMTKHRQAVLDLLRESPYDFESHSASSVSYLLNQSGHTIHPKAVHRTLRELWEAGLVVAYRVKTEPPLGRVLPRWELQFEPSEVAMAQYRASRIYKLKLFIQRRTTGFNFFGQSFIDEWEPGDHDHVRIELEMLKLGGTDDLGDLLAWEAREQIVTHAGNVVELRKLIQANHPDRPGGNPELARLAIEALKSAKARAA